MGSHVEPTTVTAGPGLLSPPHDSHDLITVGSAKLEEEIECLSPLSDEDHTITLTIKTKIGVKSRITRTRRRMLSSLMISKTRLLSSDEKLQTDKYMMSLIKKNKEGFVSISMIASFRKMKRLTRSYPSIVSALKESSMLVVRSDGKKVKRRNPLPPTEVRDPKLFTVLVENLPEDHSVENIRRIFGAVGPIKNISLRDPHAVEESKKNARADILVSSKLHTLVEYQTMEAAEKAGNYAQRRQAWMGPEPQNNSNAQASDKREMTRSIPQISIMKVYQMMRMASLCQRRKNGHRPRNKGRARKPKTRGTNGLAMERHPHLIPSNHQSHLRALECQTELGDSQWDVDDHSSLNRPSELCPCACPVIIFALCLGYCDCETVQTGNLEERFPINMVSKALKPHIWVIQ